MPLHGHTVAGFGLHRCCARLGTHKHTKAAQLPLQSRRHAVSVPLNSPIADDFVSDSQTVDSSLPMQAELADSKILDSATAVFIGEGCSSNDQPETLSDAVCVPCVLLDLCNGS